MKKATELVARFNIVTVRGSEFFSREFFVNYNGILHLRGEGFFLVGYKSNN